jgi:hypothetical protein
VPPKTKKKELSLSAPWTAGIAQTVECLFCKNEALSSNPNPNKQIKQLIRTSKNVKL